MLICSKFGNTFGFQNSVVVIYFVILIVYYEGCIDYKIIFQEPSNFGRVMTLLTITGVPVMDDSGGIKVS